MDALLETLNEWFGQIRNLFVGMGAIGVLLTFNAIKGIIKSDKFSTKIVTNTVSYVKDLAKRQVDDPERKELIDAFADLPEFKAFKQNLIDNMDAHKLELKKQLIDIKAKLKSGVLEKGEYQDYQKLYSEILAKLKELETDEE